MNSHQKIFLTINIVGGVLVLLSYIIGLRAGKSADILWGGTPKNIRGIYTVSMLVSALSFFVVTTFLFLNMKQGSIVLPYSLNINVVNILYSILLICSMIWIPLVNLMVSNPSTLIWITIRIALILVGLTSLLIFLLLLKVSPRPIGIMYYTSLVGMLIFFVHTGILDAFLWPYFWNK